jgi:CRP-like cAMP-binding protein
MVEPSADAATFLRTVPLFAELEPAHLEEVARHMHPFEVPAGTSLFRQGDDGDGMYVLTDGAVHVTTRLLGENKVALTALRRGDILGEMALLDGGKRSASARCIEATRGYFIRRTQFAMLRADLHPVALRLMRSFAKMLAVRQRAFNADIAAIEPPTDWNRPARSIPPPPFQEPHEHATSLLSREVLRSIPFFGVFNERELDELLALTKGWGMPRGWILYQQDQPGSSCFITVRGALRLALAQGIWSETLAILGPGRLAGHMSVVDGEARSATCIVRENAIILELTREVFDGWCERRSPLAFQLLEFFNGALVDGLRTSARLMARFAVEGRIRQRVQNVTVPGDQLPVLPSPLS